MVNVGDIVIASEESVINYTPDSYYTLGYLIVVDVIVDNCNGKTACYVLNQQGSFSWMNLENLVVLKRKDDN
tara:strand:- start:40 stop:255 length:216 start_codon:yes stop_codon:yes gene_type:complete